MGKCVYVFGDYLTPHIVQEPAASLLSTSNCTPKTLYTLERRCSHIIFTTYMDRMCTVEPVRFLLKEYVRVIEYNTTNVNPKLSYISCRNWKRNRMFNKQLIEKLIERYHLIQELCVRHMCSLYYTKCLHSPAKRLRQLCECKAIYCQARCINTCYMRQHIIFCTEPRPSKTLDLNPESRLM